MHEFWIKDLNKTVLLISNDRSSLTFKRVVTLHARILISITIINSGKDCCGIFGGFQCVEVSCSLFVHTFIKLVGIFRFFYRCLKVITSDSYLKFPSFCAPQFSSFVFMWAIACGKGTPCSGSYDQTTVTPIIWQSKVFYKISLLSEKGIIWLLAVLVFHQRPRFDQSFGVHLMKLEWILFPLIFDLL